MSILATPLALLDFFFVPSYWIPKTLFNIPIGIEGFVFSFEIGGIAAVVYPEFSKTIPVKIKNYHKPFTVAIIATTFALFLLLNKLNFSNVMINLYVVLLVGTALTIYIRKDLLKSAIDGALLFGGIYFLSLTLWLKIFPQAKEWGWQKI